MSSRELTQRNTYLTQIETTQKCLPVFHHCQIYSLHHSSYSAVRLFLKLTHKQITQMYCMLAQMICMMLTQRNIYLNQKEIISSGREKESGQDQCTNMPTYLPIILTTCIAYLLIFLLTYLYSYLLAYFLIILNYTQDSYLLTYTPTFLLTYNPKLYARFLPLLPFHTVYAPKSIPHFFSFH